jgi:hypothetical protein
MDMVQILEGYRNTIIGRLKFEPRTKGLFAAFIGEIRKILHEHKLPSEVLAEIRRILRETFDVLRELAKDTTAEDNVEISCQDVPKHIHSSGQWRLTRTAQNSSLTPIPDPTGLPQPGDV